MRYILSILTLLFSFLAFSQTMEFDVQKGFVDSTSYYRPTGFIQGNDFFIKDGAGLQKLGNGEWKYINLPDQASTT